MKRIAVVALLMLLVMSLTVSCKKENTQVDYNPEVNSSKDLIFIEDIFSEIFGVFYKSTNMQEVLDGVYTMVDDCSVWYKPEDDVISFGYGTVNRYCIDGKFRRNVYYAYLNGAPNADGTVAEITFDSLFVNNDLVDARMEITRMGPGQDNQGEWLVKVMQGSVTRYSPEDTVRIDYDATYTFVLKEGGETPELFEDDLFHVTGTTSGTSADHHSFSTEITELLHFSPSCFWIIEGKHQLSVTGSSIDPGMIDYITEDECNYRVDFYFDNNLFYDYLFHL